MTKINVQLPVDRNFTGLIQLEDDQGSALAGPFVVCGRANDRTAAERGNSSRTTTLPYGDTPLGSYRVADILDSGAETLYCPDEYGPHGVIVMEPTKGDAALAEANGRFIFFIQGGATGGNDRLRATNGSLRLRDHDLRKLIASLRGLNAVVCSCVESTPSASAELVALDSECEAGDPPPMRQTMPFAEWITPTVAHAVTAYAVAHGEYDPGPTPEDTTGSPSPDDDKDEEDHTSLKDDTVQLSEETQGKATDIAQDFFDATGKNVVITDGTRTTEDQAERMYDKLASGKGVDKAAAQEIKEAYDKAVQQGNSKDEIVEKMKDVIDNQVGEGVNISNHLNERAFDVRSSGMTAAEIAAFRSAVEKNGGKVINEGDHLHVQY
jgi:hypothetical protein